MPDSRTPNEVCRDLLREDYNPDPESVANRHIDKSILDSFDDFIGRDCRSGDGIAGYGAIGSIMSLSYFFYCYARYVHFGGEDNFDALCKSYWDNQDTNIHVVMRELIKASQFTHVEILKRRAKEAADESNESR